MRHRVAHRKLNRTSSHRRALRRSLVSNLIEHESIVTTLPKAKEVKAFADKVITLAKRDTLSARRRVTALLNERRLSDQDAEQKTVINKLFKVVAPRFADRSGGYTRIIRLAQRRLGDGSVKAVLQFVDQALASTGLRARRTTKAGPSRDSSRKPSEQPQAPDDQSAEKSTSKRRSGRRAKPDSSSQKSRTAEDQA